MGKISTFYTMPHPPIIIPEIGKGEEKKIQKTSDACVQVAKEIKDINPDTIIIITPHGPLFNDAVSISVENNIEGDFQRFGAGNISFNQEIDMDLTRRIIHYTRGGNIPVAEINKDTASRYGINYSLDHGTTVPLYFINQEISNYKLVHITYGILPKVELYKFGMLIKKAVEDSEKNTVLIASADLSHRLGRNGPYEYSPYGKEFDNEVISLLKKGDVLGVFNMDETMVREAGECGLRSYYIMLGAMEGNDIKGNLLSYEDIFGVGYAVMSFINKPSDISIFKQLSNKKRKFKNLIEEKNPYIRLARESLTHYLLNRDYMDIPSYVTKKMRELKRGVFVTLKKHGRLRGCIGTIFPVTENIAKEIIRNAVKAGLEDYRFTPVKENELEDIDFSVDVLTESQKATKDELDPKKFGVIVRSKGRVGLLLPDLEGVDTVEQQLSIALEKAGISPHEDYIIEKFEVIRHT